MKVNRATINFWLDTLLLCGFVALVFFTTVIRFVFPAPREAAGWQLWSHPLDDWIYYQFVALAFLTFGVLVHVMLHWSWVCGMISSWLPRKADGSKKTLDDGTRTIAGVGLLVALLNVLGALVSLAALSVRAPA